MELVGEIVYLQLKSLLAARHIFVSPRNDLFQLYVLFVFLIGKLLQVRMEFYKASFVPLIFLCKLFLLFLDHPINSILKLRVFGLE